MRRFAKKLSTRIGQLDRKISIQQGKAVSSVLYQPSVADLCLLNFEEQRKFLLESVRLVEAK